MKKGSRNQERNPESSKLTTTEFLAKAPGAYVIVNERDDVVYAGSAGNLYQRYHEHRHTLKKGNHKNSNLQKCSEVEKLSFKGFHTETREDAFDVEQRLLDQHKDKPSFCNISTDARLNAKGHVILPETQEKMRLSRIGKPRSPECIRKSVETKRANATKRKMGIADDDPTKS